MYSREQANMITKTKTLKIKVDNGLKIDKPTFIISIIILFSVCIPLAMYPVKGKQIIQSLFDSITTNFGIVYIWMGILVTILGIWICFSKYGKIVLGKPNEKPQFGNFSWAAMLFCAGIGSSILYWGMIEWVYHVKNPMLGIQPNTWKSMEWAPAVTLFNWGPTAWLFYVLPAIPIGYLYFVRKKPILKISEACRGVLKERVDGLLGSLIDVVFVFGLIGAAGTTLGLGVPLASAGFSKVFGLEINLNLNLICLFIVTALFSFSAYSGIKKGIKVLSNINMSIVFVLLMFILIFGPTNFILKMGTTSTGILIQQYFRMSTWADPILKTGCVENWTMFYFAWWIVYSPFMGLFIAKISRGRTIRNVIGGAVFYGSLGCALFINILGNYGMHLEITNALNITGMIDKVGAPMTIMAILEKLPISPVIILLFTICAIIFMATTFDSASYTLAAVTTKTIKQNQDPAKWNRLFWAFTLAVLPATLLIIDGPLSAIQTVALTISIPIIFILIIMMVSFRRNLKEDEKKGLLNKYFD